MKSLQKALVDFFEYNLHHFTSPGNIEFSYDGDQILTTAELVQENPTGYTVAVMHTLTLSEFISTYQITQASDISNITSESLLKLFWDGKGGELYVNIDDCLFYYEQATEATGNAPGSYLLRSDLQSPKTIFGAFHNPDDFVQHAILFKQECELLSL